MTIREEINQQIELAILGVVVNVMSNPNGDFGLLIREARKEIIKMEVSKGVVLKVEGELPKALTAGWFHLTNDTFDVDTKEALDKAGYEATVPLAEVE